MDSGVWVEGIVGIDDTSGGKNRVCRRWDGVLKSERGFGSALPEAREEHEEEAELSEQEGGPDARLGEHVHRCSRGKDDGGESQDSEEEEDRPGLGEVCLEGSPCGAEGAANAAVGLGWFSKDVGAKVLAELDGVDLNEVEVETEDRGDEEEDDVAGESCEKCVEANGVVVDVVCPFALKEEEWAEDKAGDEKCQESDTDEAPEEGEALLEERAEAGMGVCLVTEECPGYEEEMDDEV